MEKGNVNMPNLRYEITQENAGRTVKSIALKEMRLSRGMFSSLKFSGGILLDGQPVHADVRVRGGQVLSACWTEENALRLTAYNVDFSIPYEDDHYWIIDKPAPLPTLCSARQHGPTLENALYARLCCPENFVFRPVNRLDKGTSGLMTVAKNAHAQQLLQRQLHTDTFIREYLAVCRGKMPGESGVIDLSIGKAAGEGAKREIRPDGMRAVTHYRVEKEEESLSLVRLRLETGRTHQIRVHLAAVGCPILGDYLYGQTDDRLPGRFALHACAVRFAHPFTGEPVSVDSPLPKEIAVLISAGNVNNP